MLIGIGSWLLARSQLRRRQAEARNEYEKMFRHTLEDMDMVAVSLDPAGRVTFCNDRFLDLTGWRREEVIGRDWTSNFLDPEQGEEVQDLLRNACDPETFPTRFETEVLTRNGGQRLVAWTNTLSCDAEGGFLGVTGIGDDVTDRRSNEQELHKLFRAVEQSPSIVLITDRNGVIEYVNPKFTEVTGYQPEEVVGQNPRVLKSGETSSEEYHNLWDTVQRGGEWPAILNANDNHFY
ncbi:MAG: PAS domain S-box protein, partial [Sulfitobacter sp.]|nr:PAS domain S-box protein [Sulfitobacter sp.]